MCLITTQKEPLITEEEITVYKLMGIDGRSPCQYFQYTFDKLFKTDITDLPPDSPANCFDGMDGAWLSNHFPEWSLINHRRSDLKYVEKGFHCAFEKSRLTLLLRSMHERYIASCTIPKGSEYYKDATGLCVFNQIIVHGPEITADSGKMLEN